MMYSSHFFLSIVGCEFSEIFHAHDICLYGHFRFAHSQSFFLFPEELWAAR